MPSFMLELAALPFEKFKNLRSLLSSLTTRPWASAVLNLPDVFFNRAAIGRRGSRFTRCFFFFFGSRGATYDLSLPKVVETVIHGQ